MYIFFMNILSYLLNLYAVCKKAYLEKHTPCTP